ncbi:MULTISPECIES: VOC family protein [Burkholderia]|uniref:Glyoxalase/bleomycin resistance protein/dioxygenase n=1 Tax=Burkholderia lata (strain ATCC 17760 / DSM 23089 / LMG 22485 / NCIMB 9086 / R18194 / 383) TaxID=482957 RepID=A0A6P2R963_BURL3|nr:MULTISPECIES: VOC family protein [Burkholderia]MBN3781645.1 VOC family protein [Burkholderia sp. Ac-20345]VWC29482.1 glyoxalase/bleomycin resistance protein/dioxygenase [Burkholderia lata]VWC44207.1 glyoxalase/bleomycin resistance protein/dioxygenase [Burkholderia lata]VWD14191.1 glyoxalase/bleomycin resistance protein/dioxygenase [Burkholderia lata]VWD31475.1 glyoxalase/bleomycin resistance protein/dioxygenase [Burkholderia lata]
MTSATATSTVTLERAIAWFDIPSLDFDRAIRFYETVLQTTLQRAVIGGVPMATFDRDASSTGGSIVFDPQQMKPSANGVLVYLNAGESVVAALERAKRAGGVVQGSVVELPNNYGYVGYLIDTEGNRVGLHAPKCH